MVSVLTSINSFILFDKIRTSESVTTLLSSTKTSTQVLSIRRSFSSVLVCSTEIYFYVQHINIFFVIQKISINLRITDLRLFNFLLHKNILVILIQFIKISTTKRQWLKINKNSVAYWTSSSDSSMPFFLVNISILHQSWCRDSTYLKRRSH